MDPVGSLATHTHNPPSGEFNFFQFEIPTQYNGRDVVQVNSIFLRPPGADRALQCRLIEDEKREAAGSTQQSLDEPSSSSSVIKSVNISCVEAGVACNIAECPSINLSSYKEAANVEISLTLNPLKFVDGGELSDVPDFITVRVEGRVDFPANITVEEAVNTRPDHIFVGTDFFYASVSQYLLLVVLSFAQLEYFPSNA